MMFQMSCSLLFSQPPHQIQAIKSTITIVITTTIITHAGQSTQIQMQYNTGRMFFCYGSVQFVTTIIPTLDQAIAMVAMMAMETDVLPVSCAIK
jgi:hypothetical protein